MMTVQQTLFLLVGCTGSGKTTWIENNKLENNTIGFNQFYNLYTPTQPAYCGNMIKHIRSIPKILEHKAIEDCLTIVKHRIMLGETLFIDNQNNTHNNIQVFCDIAKQYNIPLYLVDMMGGLTLDNVLQRNQRRGNMVNPLVVERDYSRTKHFIANTHHQVITPSKALNLLNITPIDVTQYRVVHCIGDIQSANNVLQDYLECTIIGENDLVVFMGDLFDRGKYPVETLRTVQEFVNQHENTILLLGNHDWNLKNIIQNPLIGDWGFVDTRLTLQAFHDNNIFDSEILDLLNRMVPLVLLKNGDGRIFSLTHGGCPFVGEQSAPYYYRAGLLPLKYFIYGIGNLDVTCHGYSDYSQDVNRVMGTIITGQETGVNVIIHGHRASLNTSLVYSLETRVEYMGGSFSTCVVVPETGEVIVSSFLNCDGIV